MSMRSIILAGLAVIIALPIETASSQTIFDLFRPRNTNARVTDIAYLLGSQPRFATRRTVDDGYSTVKIAYDGCATLSDAVEASRSFLGKFALAASYKLSYRALDRSPVTDGAVLFADGSSVDADKRAKPSCDIKLGMVRARDDFAITFTAAAQHTSFDPVTFLRRLAEIIEVAGSAAGVIRPGFGERILLGRYAISGRDAGETPFTTGDLRTNLETRARNFERLTNALARDLNLAPSVRTYTLRPEHTSLTLSHVGLSLAVTRSNQWSIIAPGNGSSRRFDRNILVGLDNTLEAIGVKPEALASSINAAYPAVFQAVQPRAVTEICQHLLFTLSQRLTRWDALALTWNLAYRQSFHAVAPLPYCFKREQVEELKSYGIDREPYEGGFQPSVVVAASTSPTP
ncbi:hypothetical protein J2Y55_003713 [Bosea sp. BE125]|uniref:hypothetical protein n=1 Tax=Bosea sp. BE125 TaxID=2817909 RepID=UPI00285CB424|nr:hypothetical protein [Bosea sp. BE125]MDR6872694.1 hypothetical protein [Bosea sp. BE125]